MKKEKLNEQRAKIIFFCIQNIHFCRTASKTMSPNDEIVSETMQKTYQGLSNIFTTLGKDFELIAQMAGLSIDFESEMGADILEKIHKMPKNTKSEWKKCIFVLSEMLSVVEAKSKVKKQKRKKKK